MFRAGYQKTPKDPYSMGHMEGPLQREYRVNSSSDSTSVGPRKTTVLEKLPFSARVLRVKIQAI